MNLIYRDGILRGIDMSPMILFWKIPKKIESCKRNLPKKLNLRRKYYKDIVQGGYWKCIINNIISVAGIFTEKNGKKEQDLNLNQHLQ